MTETSVITNFRDDVTLTDADKEKMGVDNQVMLVKTLSYLNEEGVLVTEDNIEFYNTVAEAEAEA